MAEASESAQELIADIVQSLEGREIARTLSIAVFSLASRFHGSVLSFVRLAHLIYLVYEYLITVDEEVFEPF